MIHSDKVLAKWSCQPSLEDARRVAGVFWLDCRPLAGKVCGREKLLGLLRLRGVPRPEKMFNALHVLGYFETTSPGSGRFHVNESPTHLVFEPDNETLADKLGDLVAQMWTDAINPLEVLQ